MDLLSSRNAAIAITVVGVVLLLLGLRADVIGVGDEESFGSTQIAMTVVGALVAALGVFRLSQT